MKRSILWITKELFCLHKNLVLITVSLLAAFAFFSASLTDSRDASDIVIDEWCSSCREMDTESVKVYFENKEQEILEMQTVSVIDFEKKKVYTEAMKRLGMALSARYDEELLKRFCSGEDVYVNLNKLLNIIDYDCKVYANLPISDIYNGKYISNYMNLSEYNFVFVLGILWGCGIWGVYYENELNKKELIATYGQKISTARHCMVLILLTIFVLIYQFCEIYFSNVWRIMTDGNYVRLSYYQQMIQTSVRAQVFMQSIMQLLNVYICYFASFMICKRMKNRTKGLIVVSALLTILYIIHEINLAGKRIIFLPVGYFKPSYGLLSYSASFKIQGIYPELIISLLIFIIMFSILIIRPIVRSYRAKA